MKIKLVVLLSLLAAPLVASESYTTPINDSRQAQVTILVQAQNVAVWRRAGVALASTQAQVCTALSVPGGASCTNAQARAANARIYPQTQAGREEFWNFKLLPDNFADVDQAVIQAARYLWRDWYKNVANQTAKDAECTNAGMAAPCDLSN